MITNAKRISSNTNPEIYHQSQSERGTKEFVMSFSELKEFKKCPARYLQGEEKKESQSILFGSLIDCLLLTPDLFNEKYAVKPEQYTNEKGEIKSWNRNSKTCKEWEEKNANKTIITQDLFDEVKFASQKFSADPILSEFITSSEKQVYYTAEWEDENTGLTIPLKILVDLVPKNDAEYGHCIGDIKTTRNASTLEWNRSLFIFGYHIQAALYLDIVSSIDPYKEKFCFLLQENSHPYELGRRYMSNEYIELGRKEYTTLLESYALCVKNNYFPGYDDTDESSAGWSECFPEPWMEQKILYQPKFMFPEEI